MSVAEDGLRRQVALLQVLSDTTAALSQAATPDEVSVALVNSGLRSLGADVGFVGRVDEGRTTLNVLRLFATSPSVQERLELPLDAPYPLAEAMRRSEALFIGSNEELSCDFPGLSRISAEDHACATVPLRDGDEVFGALNVGFDEPRAFTDDDRALLVELARRCAQAMRRAEAFEAATRAHEAVERELRELRAFELNDDVVQELAVAKLAFELGEVDEARAGVRRALEASEATLARMVSESESFRRER